MDPLLSELKVIDFDAGTLFSGQASGRMIKGFAAPSVHTPTINPDYLFHDAIRELVVWFISPADPLYVFGPTGSGKTSLIRQVAAKLNYPVFDVTGHGRLEFNDLAGHLSVDNGSMGFQYGPLALAMKFGGLFLLNELDLLDPATVTGLNGVLDGAPLCIPENGGEVIPPHPMFRFVATANTNGAADDTRGADEQHVGGEQQPGLANALQPMRQNRQPVAVYADVAEPCAPAGHFHITAVRDHADAPGSRTQGNVEGEFGNLVDVVGAGAHCRAGQR